VIDTNNNSSSSNNKTGKLKKAVGKVKIGVSIRSPKKESAAPEGLEPTPPTPPADELGPSSLFSRRPSLLSVPSGLAGELGFSSFRLARADSVASNGTSRRPSLSSEVGALSRGSSFDVDGKSPLVSPHMSRSASLLSNDQQSLNSLSGSSAPGPPVIPSRSSTMQSVVRRRQSLSSLISSSSQNSWTKAKLAVNAVSRVRSMVFPSKSSAVKPPAPRSSTTGMLSHLISPSVSNRWKASVVAAKVVSRARGRRATTGSPTMTVPNEDDGKDGTDRLVGKEEPASEKPDIEVDDAKEEKGSRKSSESGELCDTDSDSSASSHSSRSSSSSGSDAAERDAESNERNKQKKKKKTNKYAKGAGDPKQALELEPTAFNLRFVPPHVEEDRRREGKAVMNFMVLEDSGQLCDAEQLSDCKVPDSFGIAAVDTDLAAGTASSSRHLGPARRDSHDVNSLANPHFPARWLEDPSYPVDMLQVSEDKAEFSKAVSHYRSLPPAEANTYHCLVNQACAHMASHQPRLALPLLEYAVVSAPTRVAAHLNLIMCYLRIHDRPRALAVGQKAVDIVEDLTAEQHRLLLHSNKDLAAALSPKRSAAHASRGQPVNRRAPPGKGGPAKKKPAAVAEAPAAVAEAKVSGGQPVTAADLLEMRKDLLCLRSDAAVKVELAKAAGTTLTEVGARPPWARLYAYSGEQDEDVLAKKARWQPLKPTEMELLRCVWCRVEQSRGKVGGFVDAMPDTYDDSESETHVDGPRSEFARQAYEVLKSRPSLQLLPPKKARALLRVADLVEFPGKTRIFSQGDEALYIYIIVSGTVRIETVLPELGPTQPVPLETMYDGQVFGDAKIATWQANEGKRGLRNASAVAQEPLCLLRVLSEDYRRAMGALQGMDTETKQPRKHGSDLGVHIVPPMADAAQEPEMGQAQEEALGDALPEDVCRKAQALQKSPFFEGADHSSLVLLASNVQEIELRYGDVFVDIGQALTACFLVSEGTLRLSVPGSSLAGRGRGLAPINTSVDARGERDEAFAEAFSNRHVSGASSVGGSRPGSAGRPGCLSRPSSAVRPGSAGKVLLPASNEPSGVVPAARIPSKPTSCATDRGSAKLSVGSMLARRAVRAPPRLLPGEATPRAEPAAPQDSPRKPGTPRRGSRWEASLRQDRVATFTGQLSHEELEIGYLHAGEAFGLGALLHPNGECPYPSGVTVRVESSGARLLVLNARCLLYLQEAVARTLVDKLRQTEDMVSASAEKIREIIAQRRRWQLEKHSVLHHTLMRDK